ncbi:MAG: glutamate-5-semialdehyde dehydrogenase, partial [Ruminococcaceae bacterium]|nr:glutamate-5-semialdehyde dehydrogenase [Oscillospiraceae bacterium]
MDIYSDVKLLCENAKRASKSIALANETQKNKLLQRLSELLCENSDKIIAANELDLDAAESNGVPKAMLDRLMLNDARIKGIADSLISVAALDDPIGKGEVWSRSSGITLRKIRVPLGVVGIIYEARPNVTVDSAALCLKTGNAVVLRGGKEAINTNKALVTVIKSALTDCGFDADAVGLIQSTDRESANALMSMRGLVDVLIPRGGKGLINACVQNSKVPVIETGAGNCHLYVDESANLDKALKIAVNAKCSRPSVCNAIETVLVHSSVAEKFLPMMAEAFEKYNVDIRGCERVCNIIPAKSATDEDFATEYDDYIVSVGVVDSLDEAISHINKYSTGHSEAIVTENMKNADEFLSRIDSVAVYVNASTRFTDGGEFGFGAEIGISTQKLHVRGPMGLMALTTEKYP